MQISALFLILIFTLFSGDLLYAQELASDQKRQANSVEVSRETAAAAKIYVFETYVFLEDEYGNVKDLDTHFLGEDVAKRMKAVSNLYIKKTDVAVGFGDLHTEILKPDVLQAVQKMERYYKKAVRRDTISKETAAQKMVEFLDIAIIVFYENNSAKFEGAIKDAPDTQALIDLFEAVEIKEI